LQFLVWLRSPAFDPGFLIRVLVALRGVIVLLLVTKTGGDVLGLDVARYREIADSGGVPYRDFVVEYPPLAYILIKTLAGSGLIALQAAADLCIARALYVSWGRRTALVYLALGTPIAVFHYQGVDFISVGLAVAAVLGIRHRREVSGGLLVVTGALVKLWPLMLLPGLWAERRLTAVKTSLVASIAALVGWVAVGGLGGLLQVLSYRGADGWEVGSAVGSIQKVLGAPMVFEQGAYRVGSVSVASKVLLAIVGLALVAVLATSRSRMDIVTVAAVSGVLLMSPVGSPQFTVWLLPWVAMTGDRWLAGWTAAAVVAGALVMMIFTSVVAIGPGIWFSLALVVRNVALAGVLVRAFGLVRGPAPLKGRTGTWQAFPANRGDRVGRAYERRRSQQH
jgi:hypothetical protein